MSADTVAPAEPIITRRKAVIGEGVYNKGMLWLSTNDVRAGERENRSFDLALPFIIPGLLYRNLTRSRETHRQKVPDSS